MAREDEEVRVGHGYPFGQLATAFVTALTHEDEETRQRAETRVARWRSVLEGMASGRLAIGSRTPVKGLPAWVTPEVVRGGFATGDAAASGPLRSWEKEVAPSRAALFAHHLTERGLADLDALLTSGRYLVDVPEEAALPTVAWLVGAGETERALRLVEVIGPFADRLRFAPRPVDTVPTTDLVYRQTAGQARGALSRRRPNERVEAMREALTVWNPFADELLELWLETVRDGRVAAEYPPGWHERAQALLDRYETLRTRHTRCTRHRRPKENLAILRTALTGDVKPGLLQHAVDSVVAKRGRPGSPEHRALRAAQAADAALPTHHALAKVVVARLAEVPQLTGVTDVEPLIAPEDGIPIPPSIQEVVTRTLAGTPEELVERGIVTSAEVLAELVPRIAATSIAAAYPDERLRRLMAATYEAFRRRRSLLLLNLEHQVRIDELPWVQAVEDFREPDAGGARAALARLAELAIEAFPATIMPSALVTELDALAREAGLELPLVEELAADIFMGRFSPKFLRAAQLAGQMLRGSLYERYYGIDYEAIAALTTEQFDALCVKRAGGLPRGFSVAANGKVIEQAQILTTHNLAALTGPFGVGVTLDWDSLARRSLDRAIALTEQLRSTPKPLKTVKNIAYAWRQMLFFASQADDFLPHAHQRLQGVEPLRQALEGRRLLGWTTERHWMLDAAARPA